MKRATFAASAATLLVLGSAGAASAYDIDAAGYGFVGKGEVQTAFGWNNKQLQDRAQSVDFAYHSTTVTEVSWVCTNSDHKNQQTQERERTTTTTVTGVVDSVARERNQVTGFTLTGFTAGSTSTTETGGPQLNSCPNFWELTTPAGDPVVVDESVGGLYAIYNGTSVLLP